MTGHGEGNEKKASEAVGRPNGKPAGGWRTLFTVALFLGLAALGIWRVVSNAQDAVRKVTCICHLKQIGLGLNTYLYNEKAFPPAFAVDATGRRVQGWRALLMPYLEGTTDGSVADLNLPWDAASNLEAARGAASIWLCPAADQDKAQDTSYVAVVGEGFLFDGATSRAQADIVDGLSQTIMVVEAADSGIAWNEPRDLSWVEFLKRFRDKRLSEHSGGFNALFADGSVKFLGYDVDPVSLKAMFTVAGREGGPETEF